MNDRLRLFRRGDPIPWRIQCAAIALAVSFIGNALLAPVSRSEEGVPRHEMVDLVAEALTASPAYPLAGENVALELTVANRSDNLARGVQVRLLADDKEVAHATVNLGARQTSVVRLDWTPASAGHVRLLAMLDPDRHFVEEHRADNTASQETVVTEGAPTGADFAVAESAIHPRRGWRIAAGQCRQQRRSGAQHRGRLHRGRARGGCESCRPTWAPRRRDDRRPLFRRTAASHHRRDQPALSRRREQSGRQSPGQDTCFAGRHPRRGPVSGGGAIRAEPSAPRDDQLPDRQWRHWRDHQSVPHQHLSRAGGRIRSARHRSSGDLRAVAGTGGVFVPHHHLAERRVRRPHRGRCRSCQRRCEPRQQRRHVALQESGAGCRPLGVDRAPSHRQWRLGRGRRAVPHRHRCDRAVDALRQRAPQRHLEDDRRGRQLAADHRCLAQSPGRGNGARSLQPVAAVRGDHRLRGVSLR